MATYAGRQRATALALWGTVASMGIAAGVLFGGVLTSVFDWRAVFFINVPIGIAVLVGALARARAATAPAAPFAPPRRPRRAPARQRSARPGLRRRVHQQPRLDRRRTPSPAAAAAALLDGFARIERSVAAPLVPPATWRIRSLVRPRP